MNELHDPRGPQVTDRVREGTVVLPGVDLQRSVLLATQLGHRLWVRNEPHPPEPASLCTHREVSLLLIEVPSSILLYRRHVGQNCVFQALIVQLSQMGLP